MHDCYAQSCKTDAAPLHTTMLPFLASLHSSETSRIQNTPAELIQNGARLAAVTAQIIKKIFSKPERVMHTQATPCMCAMQLLGSFH